DEELAQLNLHLKHATEGKGTTILISGEAGTGKTKLVETFLEQAKKKDVTILSGWCLSEVTTPYLPFIEAFNTYNALLRKEKRSFSLPQTEFQLGDQLSNINNDYGISASGTGSQTLEILQKPSGFSPQIWRDQVFAVIIDKLHLIASKKPLILFIDDIHWADSASLALLHYIARAVKNSERAIVLGTFRSDELVADTEGHPHPLAEIIRMMRREDIFAEIKLSNLNQFNLKKIAEDMIGGNLNSQFIEKLATESKGNPLFIVESLRMLSEQQGLIFDNNQWNISITELGLPTKIKDIILRRLSVLDYSQRRVLDVAATIGEKFDINILCAVLGKDVLEVLETLNIIAHSTRLVSVEENYYKFDHERSRKTVYEAIASPLKQGYHAKIAKILESSKDIAFHLSDLAYHYAHSGNKEKAIKYALVAAKDELAKFSNQQAIQHFKYVLRNIKEEQVEQKNDALEGLGDAYAANSMYEEAIKTFDKLATSDIGLVRLRALRKATDAAFHKWDKPDILLEYAKKAEELASLNRLEMGRIINNRGRAFSLGGHGDLSQDLEDYNTALEIFEEENSLADIADALWRSGIITCALGSLGEGLNRLLRSIAIFREIGDTRKETEANLAAAQIFFGLGFFSVALSKYSTVHILGEKLGMFNELAQASYGLSLIHEHDGNIREALSQILKVIDYHKKTRC
ncbi:MAG: AAA family ATPase, partial [Flavobacteriaceae bacterium]